MTPIMQISTKVLKAEGLPLNTLYDAFIVVSVPI